MKTSIADSSNRYNLEDKNSMKKEFKITKFKLLFLIQIIFICFFASYSIASEENPIINNKIVSGVEKDYLETDTYFNALKLIVISENSDFNTYGAINVEKYEDMYILTYLSERACEKAYNKFLADENIISVDVDSVLETEVNNSNVNEVSVNTDTELKKYIETKTANKAVKVAILDTGIDVNSDKIKNEIIDLNLNLSASGEENSIFDDNGHGTEIAEIISNNSNENVKIMPIKIADKSGKSSISRTYLGIKKAIENGADIINISMNTYKTVLSEILTDIINKAVEQGIVVVVSAGNDRVNTKYITPANIDSAIVVSSVTNNNILAYYSNYGETIDYTTYGTYNGKSGTSYSAASVTGIIADLLSKEESIEVLNKYAIELGNDGKDNKYGNGFVGLQYNNLETEAIIPEDKFESIIFDVDWRSLSDKELDHYLRNSKTVQLAVWFQSLSEEDQNLLISKSKFLNQDYTVYEDKLDENGNKIELIEDAIYEVEEKETIPLHEYLKKFDCSETNISATQNFTLFAINPNVYNIPGGGGTVTVQGNVTTDGTTVTQTTEYLTTNKGSWRVKDGYSLWFAGDPKGNTTSTDYYTVTYNRNYSGGGSTSASAKHTTVTEYYLDLINHWRW